MVFRSGLLDEGQCGNLPACHKREAASKLLISPLRGHSEKPDEAREKIVELMGDLPKLELFARKKTDGWDVWGNEVASDVQIGNNPEKTGGGLCV